MKKVLGVLAVMTAVILLGALTLNCGSSDNNNPVCPDDCGAGKECCEACPCATGTCNADGMCETGGDCCPNTPAGELRIDIDGMVKDASTAGPAEVAVAAIAPLEALVNPTPTLLSQSTTDASGVFHLDCFDVMNVTLGIVVLTDDTGFDGTGGNFFPTGTGVKGWDTNEEKVCVDNAVAFAVPNTVISALDQLPDVSAADEGVVMGMVVDATGTPVSGAVIKKSTDGGTTWVDLDSVYYPSADFTDMTGTSTSLSGVYVIPGAEFASVTPIIAEKDGMTFEASQVAGKAGFCFFAIIQEAS